MENEVVHPVESPATSTPIIPASSAAESVAEELQYRRSDFDSDFIQLWHDEPFLGPISSRICKYADPKIRTAGVMIHKESVTTGNPQVFMAYNPEWFATLKQNERIGVLKHELYHVIFGHLFDRAPANPKDGKLFNIAADMAINSIIGKANLPTKIQIPGTEGSSSLWFPGDDYPNLPPKIRACIKNLPNLQTMEYYFEKIREAIEEEQGGGGDGEGEGEGGSGAMGGGDTLDSHDGWGDGLPEEIREFLKEKIRGFMEEGLRRAEEKGSWGSVPSEMQEILRNRIRGEVDWRSIVKNFFGRSRTLERVSTVKKINKKAPYLFPGVRRPLRANFLFCIDQSGSMSDEEVCQGFAEVFALSNESEVDVVNFDTEIDERSLKTWKKGKKFEWTRTRCGGTDFNCIAQWLSKKNRRGKYSGVIIFTDGYAPTLQQMPGVKVIWCITPNGTMEAVREHDLAVKMKFNKKKS